MRDYVNLGTTPFAEECVEVSDNFDYKVPMRREAFMLKHQLENEYLSKIPEGVHLKVRGFEHDFGTYYGLVATFDEDDDNAREFAYQIENELPEYWDVGHDIAVKLTEFANEELSPIFIKVFGKLDKLVSLVKIYTKDVHFDLFMDLEYKTEEADKMIQSKDIDGLIAYIANKETGYWMSYTKMEYDNDTKNAKSTIYNNRKAEYYKASIGKIVREYAEDEVDIHLSVEVAEKATQKIYDEQFTRVQAILDEYPDYAEIKVCSKCGIPLRYNSMAYTEGWHFDTCL